MRKTGSCLCGHIGFVTDGMPNDVSNCHCRTCQKASGAAYVTWADFPATAVRWTAEPTWRASSTFGERAFCPECGTPVAFRYNTGDNIDLPSVLFEDTETFAPQDEIWIDSRQPWVKLDERLAHFLKGHGNESDT